MADFRFRRLDGTIAGEDSQSAERPPVMSDSTLPPVGDDSRILHELAGAASLCWEPRPTGVFDSQEAIGYVEAALQELRQSAKQERDQLQAELATFRALAVGAKAQWPWGDDVSLILFALDIAARIAALAPKEGTDGR